MGACIDGATRSHSIARILPVLSQGTISCSHTRQLVALPTLFHCICRDSPCTFASPRFMCNRAYPSGSSVWLPTVQFCAVFAQATCRRDNGNLSTMQTGQATVTSRRARIVRWTLAFQFPSSQIRNRGVAFRAAVFFDEKELVSLAWPGGFDRARQPFKCRGLHRWFNRQVYTHDAVATVMSATLY